jgi:hypothetical protein
MSLTALQSALHSRSAALADGVSGSGSEAIGVVCRMPVETQPGPVEWRDGYMAESILKITLDQDGANAVGLMGLDIHNIIHNEHWPDVPHQYTQPKRDANSVGPRKNRHWSPMRVRQPSFTVMGRGIGAAEFSSRRSHDLCGWPHPETTVNQT